jgi:hypothetical protein
VGHSINSCPKATPGLEAEDGQLTLAIPICPVAGLTSLGSVSSCASGQDPRLCWCEPASCPMHRSYAPWTPMHPGLSLPSTLPYPKHTSLPSPVNTLSPRDTPSPLDTTGHPKTRP